MAELIGQRPRKGGDGGRHRRRPARRRSRWRGAADYDSIVLDVMLPGIDGFETCRRLRAGGVWSPVIMLTALDSVEDRVTGPRHRRRRLPREAVRVRGAARPPACRRPPARGRAARACSRSTTCGSTRPAAGSGAGRAEVSLSAKEFAHPRDLHAPARRGAHAGAPARARLGQLAYENRSNIVDVYVRHLRRKIDEPFGRQTLETVRGVGLPAAPGRRGVSRLPIRLRGRRGVRGRDGGRARGARAGILYSEPRRRTSRPRSTASCGCGRSDLSTVVRDPESTARRRARRRPLRREGRELRPARRPGRAVVLDATAPLGARTAPGAGSSCGARSSTASSANAQRVPGLDEPSRFLATPVDDAATRRLVLVVGATRENRAETLRQPARRAADRRARSRCCVATRRGLPPRGPLAPPGRLDAPAGGVDLGRDAGRAAAGAAHARRGRAARRDAERDARPARGGAGARARRSSPTRATSCGRRSRSCGRSSSSPLRHADSAEELREAVRRSSRGGRPARPARRGPAADRALDTAAACRCASSRSTWPTCSRRSRAASSGGRRRRAGRSSTDAAGRAPPPGRSAAARAGARQPGRQRAALRRGRRSRLGAGRRARWSSCTSPTRARASRRSSSTRAFERFSRHDQAAHAAAARASGSRSSARSPRPTAAARTPRTRRRRRGRRVAAPAPGHGVIRLS